MGSSASGAWPKMDTSSKGVGASGVAGAGSSAGRLILDRRGGILNSSSLGAGGVRSGTGLLAGRGPSPGSRSTSSMGSSTKAGPTVLGFLARGPPEGKKERSSSPSDRFLGSSASGTKKASSKGTLLFFRGAGSALGFILPPGWGMSSKCPSLSGSTSGTGACFWSSTDWMNRDFCFRAGRALDSEATSS